MSVTLKEKILYNVSKLNSVEEENTSKREDEIVKEKLWNAYMSELRFNERKYQICKNFECSYARIGTSNLTLISNALDDLGFKMVQNSRYFFSYILVRHRLAIDMTEAEQAFKDHEEKVKDLCALRKEDVIEECKVVRKMLEKHNYTYAGKTESENKILLEVEYPFKFETEFEKMLVYYYYKRLGIQFIFLDSNHWNFVIET